MKLVTGRPETCDGRMEKEIRVYDLLDGLDIAYQRIDHEAAMTMEACAAVDEVLDATICKNLLLCNRQKTAFYLLMLPGTKVFKTSELSKKIGSSRLSFADPKYMEEYLDITPGSVSVMGLMNDHDNHVKLYMDEVLPCVKNGLCGAVYTQVSDVEDEINGFMTYDRKVVKLDADRMLPVAAALQEAIREK